MGGPPFGFKSFNGLTSDPKLRALFLALSFLLSLSCSLFLALSFLLSLSCSPFLALSCSLSLSLLISHARTLSSFSVFVPFSLFFYIFTKLLSSPRPALSRSRRTFVCGESIKRLLHCLLHCGPCNCR